MAGGGELRGAATLDQADVLDFPNAMPDGLRARSTLSAGASNALRTLAAMDAYVGDFYRRDLTQTHYFSKAGDPFTVDQRQEVAARLKKFYGLRNRREPLVLDGGMELHERALPATDLQLVESREFQITDIARAFGVPSSFVNQEQKTTSFGSGVEFIGSSWLKFSLMPHLVRIEAEITRKLLPPGAFARFDTDRLTRPLMSERLKAWAAAEHMTINEKREAEELPRLDDPRWDEPTIALKRKSAGNAPKRNTETNGDRE